MIKHIQLAKQRLSDQIVNNHSKISKNFHQRKYNIFGALVRPQRVKSSQL